MADRPNVLYVFGDQWRAQAFGYAGDPNVHTPGIDAFAHESVNFTQAVSGCPVCTPYRGSLMTGQYPNRHGLVANDLCLRERASGPFLAECFAEAGYQTAYIGKWHIDGHGRSKVIPPDRRLGFQFWRTYECTHQYNESFYYQDDDPEPKPWQGYDAHAQTRAACRYLREEVGDKPFFMMLSWGPPHNPFHTAPENYRLLYSPEALILRDNVPPEHEGEARRDLAGYYAHCTALDDAFGQLMATLDETGLADNTIVVFTSDHGDMLGSQGQGRKQRPYEESIRVPLLIRDPRHPDPRTDDAPFDAPDMMPTLLGLCGLPIPDSVQGLDFSGGILTGRPATCEDALLALYTPFHEWRWDNGGREYRGLRTRRYTYVRTLLDGGPWLLYDNQEDPFQLRNLVHDPAHADLLRRLDARLDERLEAIQDPFLTADEIYDRYQIRRNEKGDLYVEP